MLVRKSYLYINLLIFSIYYHGDHLGSTTLITDESGSVLETTSYTPYGKILSGGRESRYGYEGKEHDEGTGTMPSDRLAYYDFEGNADDSVNSYDGNITGASLKSGQIGQTYEFDSSSD